MTSEYPLVQFVATPDPDAEVRCDLNEDTTWPDGDAFSLGSPPLIGDPGGVGADYGYRTMTFNLAIHGGHAAALRKLSELASELMRDVNYLRFQLESDTPPQWFKCYRSSPGEVSMANVYRDRVTNLWTVAVSLVAEAFPESEWITQTITLTNDVTAGGVAVVLPDIVGDAPAPLVVSGIDRAAGLMYRPLLAVAPLSSWAGVQWWKVSAADPAWTTTSTDVTDAGATGGSALGLTPPPGGAGATVAGLVTTEQAGMYRLFARLRRPSTPGSLDLTLTSGGAAAVAPTTQSHLAILSDFQFVDMGLYGFPLGNMPLDAADAFGGYTLTPGSTATVTLSASSTSTFPPLHVDHIVAVPCELFESAGASSMTLVGNGPLLGHQIDGECERVGPVPSATPLSPATPLRVEGGYPMVTPGVVNVLHLLTRVQADAVSMLDTAEPLGATSTLTLKYRPRWLYLASS